jgi:superfamily II DNA or RNA helicase
MLRDYQIRTLEKAREAFVAGHKSVLMVSPTGSGKTVMFNHMVSRSYEKGKRVLILAHRSELVDQTAESLSEYGVPHGVISPRIRRTAHRVQAARVQTIINRLDTFDKPFDFIVVDEAHHMVKGSMWAKVINWFPSARILGATATPERLDGKGLGDYFTSLVEGPTARELIAQGYLSKPIAYGPPAGSLDLSDVHMRGGDYALGELADAMRKRVLTGDVIEHYRLLCDRQPAIGFTVDIADAHRRAEEFKQHGYQAAALSGKTKTQERKEMIRDLGNGALDVLFSCGVVSEGTDIPVVAAAILLRPTESLALAIQQMGRAMRPFPGKTHATILDHAGNVEVHGLPHLLPNADHPWSLECRPRVKRKTKLIRRMKQCPECFSWVESTARECMLGHRFEVIPREGPEEEDGKLELIDEDRLLAKKSRLREQGQARTFEELTALAAKRGYRNPEKWAGIILSYRNNKMK